MNVFAATLLLAIFAQSNAIQGVVVKSGGSEPLSNATVELRTDGNNSSILDYVTTEEDGRFLFANIRPGRYRLSVTRRGYVRSPLTINVAAGQPVSGVQLSMDPTGAIYGRVFDAAGLPMGNVDVHALKASYPEGRRVLVSAAAVHTNDLGEYRLFWLPPGRYYVVAVHARARSMFRQMFTRGGTAMSMSMGPGGGGLFFASSGTSDPALERYDDEPEAEKERFLPVYFGGTTDEQLATAIDLGRAGEFGGANIVVATVRARRVSGVVVDGTTGKPVEFASVTPLNREEGFLNSDIEVNPERGTFEASLLPGIHTFSASSPNGTGRVTFKVGDSDIDNLTIPTLPLFDVPGIIQIEGTPENTTPLGTLRISLRRDPPAEREESLNSSYSVPLPTGAFTLAGGVGDFRVNVAPLQSAAPDARFAGPLPTALQNAYVKSIRFGNADVLNGGLRLERPPSVPLEIVIGTNPAAVDGQVLGEKSLVSFAQVVLVPENRRRIDLFKTNNTDAFGRFHFDRIPPGDYKIFVWKDIEEGIWFDPEFMRGQEDRGLPVRLLEGSTETPRVPSPN